MKKIILLCCSLILFFGTVKALSTYKILDELKKDTLDPVCQMMVKAGSKITFTYRKITYGFCSNSCKKRFAAEPNKYLKK